MKWTIVVSFERYAIIINVDVGYLGWDRLVEWYLEQIIEELIWLPTKEKLHTRLLSQTKCVFYWGVVIIEYYTCETSPI